MCLMVDGDRLDYGGNMSSLFIRLRSLKVLQKNIVLMPKAQFGIIDIKDDDYHYGMPLASLQST